MISIHPCPKGKKKKSFFVFFSTIQALKRPREECASLWEGSTGALVWGVLLCPLFPWMAPLHFEAQTGLVFDSSLPHSTPINDKAKLTFLLMPSSVHLPRVTRGGKPLQPVPISQTRKLGAAVQTSEHTAGARAQLSAPAASSVFSAFSRLPHLDSCSQTGSKGRPLVLLPTLWNLLHLLSATFSSMWALAVTLSRSLMTSLLLYLKDTIQFLPDLWY